MLRLDGALLSALTVSNKINWIPEIEIVYNESKKYLVSLNDHISKDKEAEYIFKKTYRLFQGLVYDEGSDFRYILEYYVNGPIPPAKMGVLITKDFVKMFGEPNKKWIQIEWGKHTDQKLDILSMIIRRGYGTTNLMDEYMYAMKHYVKNNLNIGGSLIFQLSPSVECFSFCYWLLKYFSGVILHESNHAIAHGYLGSTDDKMLPDGSYPFIDLGFMRHMVDFRIKMYNIKIFSNKLFVEDKKKFFEYYHNCVCKYRIDAGVVPNLIDRNYVLHILHVLRKNPSEYTKYIKSGIGSKEGQFIYNLCASKSTARCCEIGMANGVSACYILSAPGTNLISIDPFQEKQWGNSGVKLVAEIGANDRHQLVEKKSFDALPKLLDKYGEGYFDLIFIDGWHTFDYTLVDAFYSDMLLRKGGHLVIDDAKHKGVESCVNYINSNLKHLKPIKCPHTVAAYVKIGKDTRNWDFHIKFKG